MSWIEPVSLALTAAQLATEAGKSSPVIKRLARRLAYRVRNGKATIPVFGAGGVGKSTVSKLLVGADPLNLAAPYFESSDIEVRPLKGDVPGEILAAPGQKTRIPQHWPELFKKLAKNESFGLINVVAYGYHSFMLQSYEEHDVYQPGMPVRAFANAYSSARRTEELDALQILANGMSAVNHPTWMITLITKQDLWWADKRAVQEHYTAGDYSRIIKALASAIGERNFQHEFVPVSLTIMSLASQSGQVIVPTTQGYDIPNHQRYLLSMYERVNGLLGRGRSRR